MCHRLKWLQKSSGIKFGPKHLGIFGFHDIHQDARGMRCRDSGRTPERDGRLRETQNGGGGAVSVPTRWQSTGSEEKSADGIKPGNSETKNRQHWPASVWPGRGGIPWISTHATQFQALPESHILALHTDSLVMRWLRNHFQKHYKKWLLSFAKGVV